jgi:hypothetical protein
MKTKLSLTRLTRSLLLGVVSCAAAPLRTFAREKMERRVQLATGWVETGTVAHGKVVRVHG